MKKIFFLFFLIGGISFSAVNFTNAQETKAKVSCCAKAKANAVTIHKSNCPMKGEATAMNMSQTNCPKNCPMAGKKDCPMAGTKNCPKAGTKDCPKANCPMKTGAVAGKKPKTKTGPVAEVKIN